jgi:ribose transport system ATP-binding protein
MLLEMKGITKFFGPVKALDNVDFTVGYSEIHGLLGENGAGKSTLMNILAGAIQPSEGEIFIDGQLIEDMSITKSTEMGIRFIHQELNLVNDLTVFENLFLGEELLNKAGFLDKKQMIARSAEVLKRIKLDIDPLTMVEDLETSRKQLIEIAKALLFESKLIIMDEPTTALTNKEITILFEIMRNLKDHGLSIIFISHKMPELFEICDKFTVLRDGKFIESGYFKEINEQTATNLLVGRSIVDTQLVKEDHRGEVVFSARSLTCAGHFEDVSFDLCKGEVLAITGLHGDGRSELSEALFGARPLSSGSILMNGKELKLNSICQVMKAGVGMIPRNRKERSIIKDLSILNNLSIAYFVNKHNKTFINRKEEMERFHRNQKVTNIRVDDPDNYITSLSGGNQQKVIISRWLELDSDVYIMDNPTQGIDVGAKFEIYKLINELAQRGKSLIIFSAEFPEIYKVADRCLVMYKGRINAQLNRDDLNEVNVMYYATGSNSEGINGKSAQKN